MIESRNKTTLLITKAISNYNDYYLSLEAKRLQYQQKHDTILLKSKDRII